MDSETVDAVTGWRSEPYSGGYGGLHELAEREFTGAVTDGTAWLFALNGRVVGVTGGTIESFEDADGTAYAAPDPSLPLLFAMREAGGETKAKYYTNDTPLSEADAKLSAGGFTGYVELSENVLSGDYYVVYHGGNRLACAFVGNSRETLTGDEAFERADDEVGIYEVRTVDVDVVDVPNPPEPDPEPDRSGTGSDAAAGASGAAAGAGTTTPTEEPGADGVRETSDVAADPAPEDDDEPSPTSGEPAPADGPTATGGSAEDPATNGDSPDAVDAGDGEEADPGRSPPVGSTAAEKAEEHERRRSESGGSASDPREESRAAKRRRDGEPTDAVAASESDPFSAEEQWRETRAIPSLDPDETGRSERPGASGRRPTNGREGAASGVDGSGTGDRPDPAGAPAESESAGSSEPAEEGPTRSRSGSSTGTDAPTEAEGAEERGRDGRRGEDAPDADDREAVAAELSTAREELAAARSEVDRLREENDRLEGRIETLRTDLANARAKLSETGGEATEGRTVPPSRALAGTNLFVRYESKGEATLEKAHAGGASGDEVNENLRLEVHTEFEDGDAVVGGRPYREWLADTIEYGFVEWVVRDLLYEIQATGNESAMRGLFDAVPKVDRAELDAVVDLVDEQGKKAEERRFDVVLRDRMGDPLVVANVTDSRDATTESMLDELVEGASGVADQYDDLASAFHVTASFFEPGALESVADATGGGLLSRGKQKSFVKLSRKRGFHLCLVESRDGEFHVNVPEL